MPVKLEDIEDALMLTSNSMYGAEMWLNRVTGDTYLISDLIDPEDEEVPQDLYDSDDYLLLPQKRDLGLGNNLVFDFVDEQLPEQYDAVDRIFSRRGAYGRFKDLLEGLDKLEAWYKYEEEATRKAIIEWCEQEGL